MRFEATVTEVRRRSSMLAEIVVQVAPAVADSFHVPGQYHLLATAQAPEVPFAIASAPGSQHFEYLVRANGGSATHLVEAAPGTGVSMGLAEGPGYPLEVLDARDLLLVATGTGLAPLRSVLLALERERRGVGQVSLLWGARDADELAFEADISRWQAQGVEVLQTLSRPGPGWHGATGHVQAHFEAVYRPGAVVFACGQTSMVADLRERAVRPLDVYANV